MVSFANLYSSIGTKLTSKRSPRPLLKMTIQECKNHKDMKNKFQRFGRAVGSFQERGDVWILNAEW